MLSVLNQDKSKRETYIQFPGFPPPSELFGGTWAAAFDDEDVFFRTPGKKALPFNGGIQSEAMVNLTGQLWVYGIGILGSGVFVGEAGYADRPASLKNHVVPTSIVKLDISKQCNVADELRVRNRTIRVWYLISM